jgi:ribosomal protein L37AE/L43A
MSEEDAKNYLDSANLSTVVGKSFKKGNIARCPECGSFKVDEIVGNEGSTGYWRCSKCGLKFNEEDQYVSYKPSQYEGDDAAKKSLKKGGWGPLSEDVADVIEGAANSGKSKAQITSELMADTEWQKEEGYTEEDISGCYDDAKERYDNVKRHTDKSSQIYMEKESMQEDPFITKSHSRRLK